MDALRIWHAGHNVQRFHIEPLPAQNIADHQWGVAILLAALHPSPSVELLRAALLHDVAESKTGDIPHTAKKEWPQFRQLLARAEVAVEETLGMRGVMALTRDDEAWLKACDMLDCILYAKRQMDMGNTLARRIYDEARESLLTNASTPLAVLDFCIAHNMMSSYNRREFEFNRRQKVVP